MSTTNSVEYIVAIGASAGGLTAIQELVEALPEDLNNIAVIIAQHLSPEYKSMLTEIISRKTVIDTTAITNGTQLQPNHIYVTPPNCDAIIKKDHIEIEHIEHPGPKPSIDKLFSSLANSYGKKAVGIVLSGTGQDGSKGVIELKKVGALTISQDLDSSRYSGMPQAAMTTGMIDVVCSPHEIGANILNFIKENNNRKENTTQKLKEHQLDDDYESSEDISTILSLLEAKIGTDFSNYKESTIVRRLEKRLQDKGFSNVQMYLNYIRDNEEELEEFFKYLLIGVTSFFRDNDAFAELKTEIRKQIISKDKRARLRVWVPGCATGEESVSIAILINELLIETNRYDIKVQIFATDINATALKEARQGIYSKEKVEAIPNDLRKKYFDKTGKEEYELSRDLKQTILYTRHDLTSNPPFLRLDLVSCRNLFIYFNQRLQNHIFPIFQYALHPGGLLFLGKSETVGNYKNIFNTINAKYRIFSRKDRTPTKPLKLPSTKPLSVDKKISANHNLKNETLSIHEMVKETVYHTFDSPYVIIDDNLDIIEISGDTNDFLRIKPGLANMNLLRLISEDLQIETRALVTEAIKSMKITRGRIRRYEDSGQEHLMRLIVKPLIYAKPGHPYFMVIFESFDLNEPFLQNREQYFDESEATSQHIQELEYELISNKQHMNTLVQELETTNEELQALNEELQSSNEELQASNEELETSNEELQATNEELENAYVDLRIASQKLTRQKQLMEQISMASPDLIAVVSGENLILEYVNPALENLVKNKPLENRSVMGLFSGTEDQGIIRLLHEVRSTGKSQQGYESPFTYYHNNEEHTLYFNYSLAPLQSEEQQEQPDVIVYAADVTDQVAARLKAEANARFFSTLAESLPQKIWTLNADGNITYINQTLRSYLDYTDESLANVDINKCIHKDDLKNAVDGLKKAMKTKKEYRAQYRFFDSNKIYKWHLVRAIPILNTEEGIVVWICSATDIHEQKTIEEKKDEFLSIASHELKTPLTTAKAYIELLQEVLAANDIDTSRLYVEKAYKGVTKIQLLVKDLLDVTRIQIGKLKFNYEKFEFNRIVQEAIDNVKPLSSHHKITFAGAQLNSVIDGDPARLEQVMMNFMNNAIKYSPDADEIIINNKIEGETITFEVTDFGPGVPSQYKEKIFDRFYRVKQKDDFASGLGIGLYISKQIIERHKGKIGVKNNKNSKGSTFYFEIPIDHD